MRIDRKTLDEIINELNIFATKLVKNYEHESESGVADIILTTMWSDERNNLVQNTQSSLAADISKKYRIDINYAYSIVRAYLRGFGAAYNLGAKKEK